MTAEWLGRKCRHSLITIDLCTIDSLNKIAFTWNLLMNTFFSHTLWPAVRAVQTRYKPRGLYGKHADPYHLESALRAFAAFGRWHTRVLSAQSVLSGSLPVSGLWMPAICGVMNIYNLPERSTSDLVYHKLLSQFCSDFGEIDNGSPIRPLIRSCSHPLKAVRNRRVRLSAF